MPPEYVSEELDIVVMRFLFRWLPLRRFRCVVTIQNVDSPTVALGGEAGGEVHIEAKLSAAPRSCY